MVRVEAGDVPAGFGHAQRLENMRLDELVEGSAADNLHEVADETGADIGIISRGTRAAWVKISRGAIILATWYQVAAQEGVQRNRGVTLDVRRIVDWGVDN